MANSDYRFTVNSRWIDNSQVRLNLRLRMIRGGVMQLQVMILLCYPCQQLSLFV